MENRVDLAIQIDVLGHVVMDESESLVSSQVSDVPNVPRDQIVESRHLMALEEKAIGEMASEKSGGAGDDYTHDPRF